jgi:hypothetical protein
MWSYLGICGSFNQEDQEREPLLPLYNDDTRLEQQLHEKMHTYMMIQALSKGYMPSNKQIIANLRALLSADMLNRTTHDLSDSGNALILDINLWIKQFIELLQHKNPHDHIQDFIWYLSRSRLSVDTGDIATRVSNAAWRADAAAGKFHAALASKDAKI